nr:MAK10-like protein [Tanacetum cinerariifolium]
RTIDHSTGGKLQDRNANESWALLKELALYNNESWNDPRDFAKPVKAISLPQDVLSTSDRRLIKLESQVQRLMEAHLAFKSFVQVNKITSSCKICSGPHDTKYCMENPEQAFVNYASSRTDEARGKWFTFKPEQNNLGDTYNLSWKSHPNLKISLMRKSPRVLRSFKGRFLDDWRGAHYSYNCPPKVLVVPDPEPFNNQTVDELLQTLPSFDPTCYSNDGNSFTNDSTSNLFPIIHQPIHEKTCAELLAEEQEANIDTQPFQYSVISQPPQEEMSVDFLQEKRNQMDSVKTFLRKFNRISFYKIPKVLSLGWETILEIELAFEDKHCQPEDILELFQRLHNDVKNIREELGVYINTPNWDRPTVRYSDDDDEDYAIEVTPSLSTEEPDNSLSMGDEHLDTILATESGEFINSSVESLDFSNSNDESTLIDDDSFSIDNIEYVEASPLDSELVSLEVMELVIPEVGGIDDDILLTIKDDVLCEKLLNVNLLIINIEALNDNPTPYSDFMTKSSSTSLNSLLEETNTFHNSVPEFEIFCFDLEEISSGSTTTRSDISLPKYEAFYDDHVKEINSGSTTTHSDSSLYDSFIFDLSINPFPSADRSDFYEFADELAHIISPPDYDCFCFKIEPNSGDFTMDVVEDTFPTREPRVHNALPTHPTLQLNLDFILSSESFFTYVVWIFLPFLSYLVAPQYLLSFGNEYTIFDPSICSYHISSFLPDVSHRSETFIKFKVLNESPMEISFSTCSPMNQ